MSSITNIATPPTTVHDHGPSPPIYLLLKPLDYRNDRMRALENRKANVVNPERTIGANLAADAEPLRLAHAVPLPRGRFGYIHRC